MSVRLSGAIKRFGGVPVVNGIDAEIETGEFFVVLGPSGCGKSTLLRMISGLEPLDQGEIALSGETVSGPDRHVPPEARKVGVVFQSYALWPHMTVRDNVAFPAESAGLGRAEARARAEAHLDTVAMAPLAGRQPADLSGGQRQRVALARCLAGDARTILMDEPLANLDPHLRGRMEVELATFQARSGVTMIYITHDQREAMALADRIAVMWEGRFLQIGPPQEIHDRPACAEVARFIGRAAVLDARCGNGEADLGPVRVPLTAPADGACQVVIRPGDVVLGQGDLSATLRSALYRGGVWEGLAEVDGLAEPLPVSSDHPLRTGERLTLAIRSVWALPGKYQSGPESMEGADLRPTKRAAQAPDRDLALATLDQRA